MFSLVPIGKRAPDLKYCMFPNMYATIRTLIFCVCLTGALQLGLCSQFATEQQLKLVNGVFKDLPTANCDMIVVSTSPFHGETPCTFQMNDILHLNPLFRNRKEHLLLHIPETAVQHLGCSRTCPQDLRHAMPYCFCKGKELCRGRAIFRSH